MDGDGMGVLQARTALLDRLLAEAAEIGEAARDALEGVRADMPPVAKLRAHHEIGVIATCLGFSVAWLLEQKAIAAGELTHGTTTGDLGTHAIAPAASPAEVGSTLAALGRDARAFGLRIHRLAAH